MKYINKLDSKFLLDFGKKFFKTNYNSDNIFVEKVGSSCVIKCFVNNKHTLVISLKDFSVECKDILCKMLASESLKKELIKHYGEEYLGDLREYLAKKVISREEKKIRTIDNEIIRLQKEIVR